MTTRLIAAALGAAGVLLLSACGGTGAQPAAASPSSSTAAPRSTSADPPMDSGDPQTGIPTAPQPAPLGEASRTPTDVAQAVMTAYVVTGPTDPDTWYRRIAPFLLPQARRDYTYVDPAQVKAHQLVGLAAVTRQTDYLAEVTQNTDAGIYLVHLARDDDGLWKVSAIDEPTTPGS